MLLTVEDNGLAEDLGGEGVVLEADQIALRAEGNPQQRYPAAAVGVAAIERPLGVGERGGASTQGGVDQSAVEQLELDGFREAAPGAAAEHDRGGE